MKSKEAQDYQPEQVKIKVAHDCQPRQVKIKVAQDCQPEQMKIKEVPDCHPGMDALLNLEDISIDDIRWELFFFIVRIPRIDCEYIRNLDDPTLIYPICQLHVIQHGQHKVLLNGWEVQLFLLEHLRFQKRTTEDFFEISHLQVVPGGQILIVFCLLSIFCFTIYMTNLTDKSQYQIK